VLIHVWAEFPPARMMLPWLQELSQRLEGRPDVALLTISVDDNPGVVEPIFRDNGYTFPVVFAHDYIRKLWGKEPSLPCTWIVDRQGVVRREDLGYGGDRSAWLDSALRGIEQVGTEPPSEP